ncbi:GNAT family N-acetyltransferase [Allonocardiopsis opalescens]|uniref:Acetyltransferase (GNAT) family protein n=1 Tax=Allonocardiopsis opalescens TaxID=1144618 RepID=A0A2T0QAS2_9ACTN|nr:GNAT family N-acetyltransferase [Allonocardiopsis opalescens]PRY00910.1 acetyltransferase (GNAT) family protein [Allonocardiopsis opalescens]
MVIETREPADPELSRLVAAQQAELAERYGDEDGHFPLDPAARFLVAVDGGEAVGCGAVQRLDERTAELKRMYVRPDRRGEGISRLLLAALEDAARAAGHELLRLEAGTRQPEAVGLYTRSGYRPIPAYGMYAGNPLSLCFEKELRFEEEPPPAGLRSGAARASGAGGA